MAILLTGLTGTVGGPLVEELQKNDVVFCLVRNKEKRINNGLINGVLQERILDSDITKNDCGLSEEAIIFLKGQNITKIVHCAALVKFDDSLSDDIWSTNFHGTKNMICLAKKLGVLEFHYVSTAYATTQRNPYEASKAAAEKAVKDSGLDYSIYPLGIVVGDSSTGQIKSFDGYYGYISAYYRIAQREKRKKKVNGKIVFPVFINCSFTSTLNLVPIDWVIRTLLLLMKKKPCNKKYFITHPSPPGLKWAIEEGLKYVGVDGVKFFDLNTPQPAHSDRLLGIIQRAINKGIDKYSPYVTWEMLFPLLDTEQALGSEYVDPPCIDKKFLATILDFAVENDFRS